MRTVGRLTSHYQRGLHGDCLTEAIMSRQVEHGSDISALVTEKYYNTPTRRLAARILATNHGQKSDNSRFLLLSSGRGTSSTCIT